MSTTLELELIEHLKDVLQVNWIYPVVFPDNITFPAVRLQRISGRPIITHSGDGGAERARFQVSVFASTYSDAKQVTSGVRSALSAYSGPLGDYVDATCLIVNETDLYEPDSRLHHVALDVDVIATNAQ